MLIRDFETLYKSVNCNCVGTDNVLVSTQVNNSENKYKEICS